MAWLMPPRLAVWRRCGRRGPATVERERSSAYTASHLGALLRAAQLARVLGADLPGLSEVPAAVAGTLGVNPDTFGLDLPGCQAWDGVEL